MFLYKYSESEQKKLLKSLVVLIDRREKLFDHITDYFDSKGIKHKEATLNSGDYSFMVPANSELGIWRDIYFDNQVIIERKNSLEELSQNLAQSRERFTNEFLRSNDCRKFLMIEKGNWSDIMTGNYKTEFPANSYFASLLAFQLRYNLNIAFVDKEHAGQYIYGVLFYYLRELIR